MDTQEIIALTQKYVMNTYGRFPVAFVRGEGCYLWDPEGKRYLDLLAGIAVCGLGHSHPQITEAVQRQASALIHTSNLYYIASQAKLAQLLCDHSFADKVFFCNSGAEANEAAIKLARKYGKQIHGEQCYEIISAERSFHGRTFKTMAATGQERIKRGFEPLPPGFSHVPYDDIQALKNAITAQTCAILLEPVQGEGGVRYPADSYLQAVRELCNQKKIALIFDEIQTGMGRTGKLFAYEHSGVEPDILTLAKSLGNGIPIGACLASDSVASAFGPGDHGSTFGGNFLSSEAAIAFLKILLGEGFLEQVHEVGEFFKDQLSQLKTEFPFIQEVRGRGLMIGVELNIPGRPLVEAGLREGLILNYTQEKVLRFVPPLILTREQVQEAIEILRKIFKEF